MVLFRVRWTFSAAHGWQVHSVRRSNEFALVPVQNVERKGEGRHYLPVLAVGYSDGAMITDRTPYQCVVSYLATLTRAEKDLRRMQWLAAPAPAPTPLPDLDFA